MGMFIIDIMDFNVLNALTSNSDPYMIEQDLIKQAARELIKTIKSLELYPTHRALITDFELIRTQHPSIYGHRSFYIWQMSQAAFQMTSLVLSEVDFLQANNLKCQASFISVLLDDIGDMGRDQVVFDKCILALKGQVDASDTEFVALYQLIAGTWLVFQAEIEQTLNYNLLKPMLEDAYQKWIDSFEYGLLIQKSPEHREDWQKHIELIGHSSMLYFAGLVDLLFVPNLSLEQVPAAAQVFLRTQEMAQIANWSTTWTRELKLRDFSSGIFAIALEKHWIESDDLSNLSTEELGEKLRNSPAEKYLWDEWERLRLEAHEIVKDVQLPALAGYVESFSAIMFMLVASTKLL